MDDFNPGLYAKLTEALQNPFVRVGTIHKVEPEIVYDMPGLKVTLSWMEPQEDDADCPDVHALELLIPAVLMDEAGAQLNAFRRPRPRAKNQTKKPRNRPKR